jgi:hypothetical protein
MPSPWRSQFSRWEQNLAGQPHSLHETLESVSTARCTNRRQVRSLRAAFE